MRRLSIFVAFLLLLAAAAPMLACVTDQAMSREESACCRAMHNDCGDMAKMGCCHLQSTVDNHPQALTAVPSVRMEWTAGAVVAPLFTPEQGRATGLFKAPDEHSPPGLRLVKTTILRI